MSNTRDRSHAAFAQSFVKLALPRWKKEELARQHGLVTQPGTQWKWALRELRKGRRPDLPGGMPADLTSRLAERSTATGVETGARWNDKRVSPIYEGGLGTVSVTGTARTNPGKDRYGGALTERYVGRKGLVRAAMGDSNTGEFPTLKGRMLAHIDKVRTKATAMNKARMRAAFNTAHVHPGKAVDALIRTDEALSGVRAATADQTVRTLSRMEQAKARVGQMTAGLHANVQKLRVDPSRAGGQDYDGMRMAGDIARKKGSQAHHAIVAPQAGVYSVYSNRHVPGGFEPPPKPPSLEPKSRPARRPAQGPATAPKPGPESPTRAQKFSKAFKSLFPKEEYKAFEGNKGFRRTLWRLPGGAMPIPEAHVARPGVMGTLQSMGRALKVIWPMAR